jgi:hypothetical protein
VIHHFAGHGRRRPELRHALAAGTALLGISDEESARGLRALEEAVARETAPQPVIDRLDLAVFRATGS